MKSVRLVNSVTKSSQCSVLPCTIAKSAEKPSVINVLVRSAACPRWKRRNTVFATNAIACWATTISRGCTPAKSTIKRNSLRRSQSASRPPKKRSPKEQISSPPWKSNTSKSCKKSNQSKGFVISKWTKESSRSSSWQKPTKIWMKNWKLSPLRSTLRIKSWPNSSYKSKRLM